MKYIGGLSTILSKSIQLKYNGGLSTLLSESIQMRKKKRNIEGWSNILSEFVQQTFMKIKTKTFCFRKKKHTWKKCMCEGVSEDSRHGAWHVAFM